MCSTLFFSFPPCSTRISRFVLLHPLTLSHFLEEAPIVQVILQRHVTANPAVRQRDETAVRQKGRYLLVDLFLDALLDDALQGASPLSFPLPITPIEPRLRPGLNRREPKPQSFSDSESCAKKVAFLTDSGDMILSMNDHPSPSVLREPAQG